MVEQTARCNIVQSFVVCIFDFLLSIERPTRCNYLLLFQICRAFFFLSSYKWPDEMVEVAASTQGNLGYSSVGGRLQIKSIT